MNEADLPTQAYDAQPFRAQTPNTTATRTSMRLVPVPKTASLHVKAQFQEQEIEKLYALLEAVRDLGSELALDLLMERIVKRVTSMMSCARTSVFLLDTERNELYTLAAEGLESREIRLPAHAGLVGHVMTTGQTLNVPDAYLDPRFNRDMDRQTGFHTRSVLAMPLHDRKGGLLGVIQCLNFRGATGTVLAFDGQSEVFLSALAGLVGVFLENAKLSRQMEDLFDAIVAAVSHSIDGRDPCTAGHSRRVTLYALNLARAVHESDQPPFDRVRYTRERFRQLRFAGLLHDVGKIGVREYVLCKADKLPQGGAELVRVRLELLLERRKADLLQQALECRTEHQELLRAGYEPLVKEIRRAIALIEAKNKPGFVSDAEMAELTQYCEKGWLTPTEYKNLAVRRGNLTAEEMEDMRSHVTKSFEILTRIPWPTELLELPEIAYTHHEKLDGSGYPRKLSGSEIHFDGQIMTVADIYDALTASDRPYKQALPHEVAKRILTDEEAGQGKLNADLVQLFFEKKCYVVEDRTETEAVLQTAYIPVE